MNHIIRAPETLTLASLGSHFSHIMMPKTLKWLINGLGGTKYYTGGSHNRSFVISLSDSNPIKFLNSTISNRFVALVVGYSHFSGNNYTTQISLPATTKFCAFDGLTPASPCLLDLTRFYGFVTASRITSYIGSQESCIIQNYSFVTIYTFPFFSTHTWYRKGMKAVL